MSLTKLYTLADVPDFDNPEEMKLAWEDLTRKFELLQRQLIQQRALETNTTVVTTDFNIRNHGSVFVDASVSSRNIYLPNAYEHKGRIFTVKRIDGNTPNMAIVHGAQNIGTTIAVTVSALASYSFQSNGEQYYIVFQNG